MPMREQPMREQQMREQQMREHPMEERGEIPMKEQPVDEERIQKLLLEWEKRVNTNTEFIKAQIWGHMYEVDSGIL